MQSRDRLPCITGFTRCVHAQGATPNMENLSPKILLAGTTPFGLERIAAMLSAAATKAVAESVASLADGRARLRQQPYDLVIIQGQKDNLQQAGTLIREGQERWQATSVCIIPEEDETLETQFEAAGATACYAESEVNPRMLRRLIRLWARSRVMLRVQAENTHLLNEMEAAAMAHQESESRFHRLADSMPQLVWTARADGTVDYYNQRYREFAGIRPEQGDNPDSEGPWEWSPVLHPGDVTATVAAWDHAVRTGTQYEIEHRVHRADGTYRWYLSRGVPMRNAQGEVVRWFGTATDIHAQKMAEEALRASEMRFRRLVESNIIGVFFAQSGGLITEANDAFLNMVGYSRAEIENGTVFWTDFTQPEVFERERALLENWALESGSYLHEMEYFRRSGECIPVLVGYAPLDNSHTDYVCFSMDLSRQKQAERSLADYATRLEVSNRELEQFAYSASHDLQEPLRKVQAFASLLEHNAGAQLNEEERDYLMRIGSSAKRMQEMVDSLLSLARITSRPMNFSPSNLDQIVREVLNDLELAVQSSGAQISVGNLPVIHADPMQIRQLLQNLIGNALKFHHPGQAPVVQISGRSLDDDTVEIRVQDQGIGFAIENLQRIFDPFVRLQARRNYPGTGMGLAICRRIVERHDGQISAESAPGKGSTFIVTLPKNPRPEANLKD